MAEIVLVDDDANILASVRIALEADGFRVRSYTDGHSALAALQAQPADIGVFDIKMPRMDGLELLRKLRQTSKMPVVFLTSKDDEIDEIFGLKMGADDYITKPFSLSELKARIKALLYRTKANAVSEEIPGFQFLSDEKKVIVQGNIISLTKSEFKLLEYLYNNRHKVCSRAEIIEHCWEKDVYDRVIDVNISRMRKKFEICSGENIISNIFMPKVS